MSDDQRKQEVLAADDATCRVAAEMKMHSKTSPRLEAEARTLSDSRMAFFGIAASVQEAINAMERTHTGTGKALVEIAEGVSGLEGRLTPILQAGNERIAGMDAKMDKSLSERSSQVELIRSALDAQSTRIAALENLFSEARDTLASLAETARQVSILARVALGLGIVSVGAVGFLVWVLHK